MVTSLKNKYGIVPFAVPPNGLTARYVVEAITNVLLDTRRLQQMCILPRGIPKSNSLR
jgi:hypothetical protein